MNGHEITSNSDTILTGIANDDSNSVPATTKSPENDEKIANDENVIGNPEALAKGISTLLGGVIRDFDSKAEDVSRSQNHLSSAVDRLTAELDKLLEDAPLPFIMQHATKLSNVRKRVSSLNAVLRSVQHRLDNIERMMSIGSHANRSNTGGSK